MTTSSLVIKVEAIILMHYPWVNSYRLPIEIIFNPPAQGEQ